MAVYGTSVWVNNQKPSAWKYYAAYTASTVWTVPSSGWYRVHCIGKSGNGGIRGNNENRNGAGGGGSGGVAVSELLLSATSSVSLDINSTGTANFNGQFYATAAGNGQIDRTPGLGGSAYNGNTGNFQGVAGGYGGLNGAGRGSGYPGERGENQGMIGGFGGSSQAQSQPAGGGGGGGARLPGDSICPYVYTPDLGSYRGASGGNQNTPAVTNASEYPYLAVGASMKLYGGGGGAGGHGHFMDTYGGVSSGGSPAIIIIEVPA